MLTLSQIFKRIFLIKNTANKVWQVIKQIYTKKCSNINKNSLNHLQVLTFLKTLTQILINY